MKGFRFGLLVILAGVFFVAAAISAAQDYAGLWVGTATLKWVSEVNRREPDLSFDLGLAGVKAEENLVSDESQDWVYNDTGADLGTDWKDPDYSVDTTWSSGPPRIR